MRPPAVREHASRLPHCVRSSDRTPSDVILAGLAEFRSSKYRARLACKQSDRKLTIASQRMSMPPRSAYIQGGNELKSALVPFHCISAATHGKQQ